MASKLAELAIASPVPALVFCLDVRCGGVWAAPRAKNSSGDEALLQHSPLVFGERGKRSELAVAGDGGQGVRRSR